MPTITEIIKKRFSCRTYTDKPIEKETLQKLKEIIYSLPAGPFGGKPCLTLVSAASSSPQEWKQFGTYGIIKNARLFLVGTMKDAHRAMEDYGYCQEKIILQATALGLGTCWLGGTFKSSNFAKYVDLQKDELMPTVVPIGYPAKERSFTEKMMRRVAGSDNRKPWVDIFFIENFFTPLTKEQAGIYAEALENVHLAPSASNKQPWRILYEAKLNIFHFFIARDFSYRLMGLVSLQDIDLGIAMSHFDLTLQEQGSKGKWLVDSNIPKEKSLDYIASWQGEN